MQQKRSCALLKKIWNHGLRKKINVHLLEYWARCRASPAQPEIKKSIKGGRVQTLEKTVEAKSRKPQAPSFKRHEKDTIEQYKVIRKKKLCKQKKQLKFQT